MQTLDARLSEIPADCTTLLDLLRWRAQEQPNQRAYTFLQDGEDQEVSLTYGELDHRARAIAAQLQTLAVPGDRALLLVPPSLDFFAAFFGCLYAGVVAVPTAPPRLDRGPGMLESILTATGATVALTTTSLRATLDSIVAQVPALEHLQWVIVDALPAGIEDAWRAPGVAAESLACLLLTSGSTSTPKAIMHSHSTLLGALVGTCSHLELTSQSHLVSWMPPHAGFAVAVSVLLPIYGGFPATSMSPDAFLQRPLRWLQAISRVRGTHSPASNFAFDLCARTISPEEREALDLSCWEMAINGGEFVRPDTLERFATAFAPAGFRPEAFCPGYGMSEAMLISSTSKRVEPMQGVFDATALEHNQVVPAQESAQKTRLLISCGAPAVSVRVLIVDPESLTPCPPDRVGEIWIAGQSLAAGYWNRPEETERTFHAYLADTGEGPFLRTGDLGFLYKGALFLIGRLKDLIIIRGRNLSPERIELTAEQSHPALRSGSAAAFSVDVDDEERLVVVQEVDPQAENYAEVVAAIRQAVAEQHEVQAYAVVLIPRGTMPKTASGKVQRQPCRAAFLAGRLETVERSILEAGSRPELEGAYVAPHTPTEQTLAQIWAQLLRVERVGIHDNFFQLGGDSLTSMQVIARSRQAGLDFTVEQLVEHQTIADLAPVVGMALAMEAEQGLVTGPAPLLPTQQRFFELQPPEYYHVGFYRQFTARQHLDPGLLYQAVQHVVAHHDALRMRFFPEEARWRQVNMESEDHHIFSYMDLSWMSPEQQEGALAGAGEQLHYTLDLATGPITRVTLFDLGPEEPSVVVIVVHHLVSDAVSFRILLEDLGTAYQQLSRGEAVQLPAKTLSVKAWAEQLVEYSKSPELRDQLDYWLAAERKSVPALPVEPLSPGPGGTTAVWLGADETKTLIYDVPRVYGTEINDVLLTALVRAFAEWTGSRSLLVDLVGHGRDPIFPNVDLSRTVGWLAAFFPVVLDLGEVHEPGAELRAIKEQLRRIPTRGLGYGVLRYVSQDQEIVDALRSVPEPQVRFNYAGTFDPMISDSALFTGGPSMARPPAPADPGSHIDDEGEEPELLVSGQLLFGQLCVVVQSGKVVRNPATVDRLAQNYLEALRAIIASCREMAPAS
jgi:non-ribosomal peptide synthase protein (TIGR01720 family)